MVIIVVISTRIITTIIIMLMLLLLLLALYRKQKVYCHQSVRTRRGKVVFSSAVSWNFWPEINLELSIRTWWGFVFIYLQLHCLLTSFWRRIVLFPIAALFPYPVVSNSKSDNMHTSTQNLFCSKSCLEPYVSVRQFILMACVLLPN